MKHTLLLSLLLLAVALPIPFRTQNIKPLSVVSEKGCKQVEKEEILISSTSPSAEPPCFFPPNAPSTLTRYYPRNLHSTHHPFSG